VGNDRIALFEIARVYLPRGARELPDERLRVAAVAEGGFARAKGAAEALLRALHAPATWERTDHPLLHPGKAARTETGVVGELHPSVLEGSWSGFELDLAALAAASVEAIRYEDVLTFPAVKQDLAFVVDETVKSADLEAAAREAAGAELRTIRVFDVYRGDQIAAGKKSLAFRVEFQSPERTLADEDAAAVRDRIVQALAQRFGAELRA
jgi:phenylalanyl-tRNA synthetase beta chain